MSVGMWKGRELVICAVALFAGNLLGDSVPLPPFAYLCLAFTAAVLCIFFRNALSLTAAMILLGAFSLQAHRMPPDYPESALKAAAATSKEQFSSYLESILPPGEEETAIFKALAIGDKTEISRPLKEAYRESGAMHLLALSGLHVGIIYALFSALFGIFGGHRAVKLVRSAVTVAFLWQFALVSGLSPSIFRAVLMITFYEIAGIISSEKDGPAALAGSAIVIMLLQPEAPRELSFQLSYSAIIGIYVIYPKLCPLLDTEGRQKGDEAYGYMPERTPFCVKAARKLLKAVWQTICMSISCQATCGLLGYLYFGTFPKYFLITNLLAIPLATLVMYCTAAAILTSVFPFAGGTIAEQSAVILKFAIHLLNSCIRLLSEL